MVPEPPRPLCRRLALRGRTTVLTSVLSADREASDARGEEGKGVALVLGVEVVVAGASRGRAVASRLESRLGSTAVERTGRVGAGSWRKVRVKRRVRSSAAPESGRKSISARRSTELLLLAIATARGEVARCRGKRSGSWSAGHGALSHVIGRRGVHGRRVARVSNHSSTSAAGAAAKTADVLGEVVVSADLVTALPVAGTEGNHAATTHPAVTAAVVAVVAAAHMRRRGHHGWWSVTITARIAHIAGRTSTGSRERAAEARRPTLEVREAA